MKQYYGCPAESIRIAGHTVYRPALANAADRNGGCWKVVEQNREGHDGLPPTHFMVAVNDRLDTSLTSNPAVWTAVNAVAAATLLGSTFLAARAQALTLYGQARADRMQDQIAGNE